MSNSRCVSRRAFIGNAALLAGATAVPGLIASPAARAQQKVPQASVKYQDKPNGKQQCNNCLQFVPGNTLVIVLGDHQPPGSITNHDPSHAVPVHVISRDRALVDGFAADGYAPGMSPPVTGAVPSMATFLTTLVAHASER